MTYVTKVPKDSSSDVKRFLYPQVTQLCGSLEENELSRSGGHTNALDEGEPQSLSHSISSPW